MNNEWFYEYILTIMEDDDEVERQGVTCACNMCEAMENIYDYYREDIVKITMLKPIFEGRCFDFNDVEDYGGFDFTVYKKR